MVAATDPMSSSNPYASAASPGGYQPKKKRSKWLWIGLGVLALIIIGAVLGGVLGTQLNKKDGSSNTGSSGASSDGSQTQDGVVVPSGVSSINTAQATNTAPNRYLAVQTDTYMLPVYATPVCPDYL
jgi:flagellar basal body-associated protein FliL